MVSEPERSAVGRLQNIGSLKREATVKSGQECPASCFRSLKGEERTGKVKEAL